MSETTEGKQFTLFKWFFTVRVKISIGEKVSLVSQVWAIMTLFKSTPPSKTVGIFFVLINTSPFN